MWVSFFLGHVDRADKVEVQVPVADGAVISSSDETLEVFKLNKLYVFDYIFMPFHFSNQQTEHARILHLG